MKHNNLKIFLALLTPVAAASLGALPVLAAPINYSTDTNVTLSSASLVIESGSTASTTQATATSLIVTLQVGGSFAVHSTDRELQVTGHSASALLSNNCSKDGLARVALTSPIEETITITAKSNACTAVASGGGSSSSGGGGGGGGAALPTTPSVVSVAAVSIPKLSEKPGLDEAQTVLSAVAAQVGYILANRAAADVPAKISEVVARLNELQKALAVITGGATTSTASAVPASGSYTKPVPAGSTGGDVSALQNFLKSQGSDVYPEGIVSGYFGSLTQKAVQKFQEKNGIAKPDDPGYGTVGPKTRAKINELLGL